jgi:hypothetical protein
MWYDEFGYELFQLVFFVCSDAIEMLLCELVNCMSYCVFWIIPV